MATASGDQQQLDGLSEFLQQLLGARWQDVGAYVRGERSDRQIQFLSLAQEMCETGGLQIHPVPFKVVALLLEGSALEDDPTLIQTWAALLANAAGSDARYTPAFADILRKLSADDAAAVQVFANEPTAKPQSYPSYQGPFRGLPPDEVERGLNRDNVWLELSNLLQLGVLEREAPSLIWETDTGLVLDYRTDQFIYRFTELGYRFYLACRPPNGSA